MRLKTLSIIFNQNGYKEYGIIETKDIEYCLHHIGYPSIKVIKNGTEMEIGWCYVRESNTVKEYIEENLPEYLI